MQEYALLLLILTDGVDQTQDWSSSLSPDVPEDAVVR